MMRFQLICTSGYGDHYRYMIELYLKRLTENGFRIERDEEHHMVYIHVITLDDLLRIIEITENELIIQKEHTDRNEPILEIYDDWRE